MDVGQKVYTVNNLTNKVDTWTHAGILPTKDELLIRLEKGDKWMYLPARCVFTSKKEAQAVLNKS